MGLYEQFSTNSDLERSGVVLEYGENSKGELIQICIARAGGANNAYVKSLETRTKPYRRQITNETISEHVMERIMHEVFADSIVLGWTGVEGPDGEPIPYSKANAIKLFQDLPDLFADIREQATKSAIFRTHILEEEAGN